MINIKLGATGKIIEPLSRGGSQNWEINRTFEYIGYVDGCGTKLHVFRSIVGGYEMTIAERDFITGDMHFTGSPDTQRKPRRYNKQQGTADYISVGLRNFTDSPKGAMGL